MQGQERINVAQHGTARIVIAARNLHMLLVFGLPGLVRPECPERSGHPPTACMLPSGLICTAAARQHDWP